MNQNPSVENTQQIQAHIRDTLDKLALDKSVPGWVVRSIRFRVPELSTYASRSVRRTDLRPRRGALPAEPISSSDLEQAVTVYARALIRRSVINGRDSTQLLMHSALWWRSLPCCSKVPIWPLCRKSC